MADIKVRVGAEPAGQNVKWVDRGDYVAQEVVAADPVYTTVSYESLAVAGTAVGFDVVKIALLGDAGRVRCRVLTAQVNVRVDGTNPTAGEGEPFEVGETFYVTGIADVTAFRAIRTGSSAVIKCSYEAG